VIAESVVVPDGGDNSSGCEPPDGADGQDAVPLMPGSWPCVTGLGFDHGADGLELVAAPPPPTPLQLPSSAVRTGWQLQPRAHLSAARNWVWRRAATSGWTALTQTDRRAPAGQR